MTDFIIYMLAGIAVYFVLAVIAGSMLGGWLKDNDAGNDNN